MVPCRPVNGPIEREAKPLNDNAARPSIILTLAGFCTVAYLILALGGDWRDRLPEYFILCSGLIVAMWLARRHLASAHGIRLALLFALIFRIVAAFGQPSLSDDVYRYVWDGQVQAAGFHPFSHAPDAAELESLRDADWARINHPELRTIYPPGAQAIFAGLGWIGAGPTGFRLFFGLVDFAVVLLLFRLLRRTGRPVARVIWYAWNPLAIVEVAGSGHLEPLGVLFLLLALEAFAQSRPGFAGAALGVAIEMKLLPFLLIAGWSRKLRISGALGTAVALTLLSLPYALTGPGVGGGLFAYARHWSANGFLFEGILSIWGWLNWTSTFKGAIDWLQSQPSFESLPFDFLYRSVWPQELARLTVATIAGTLALWTGWRRSEPERAIFLVLGAAVFLAPTVHPWYALWVLPFAAAAASPGWLWFAAVLPLAYLGGETGVPWAARCVEYLPAFLLLCWPGAHRWARSFLEQRSREVPEAST